MVHSFLESPAFGDHPIASIVVNERSREIVSINKAAKKLFGGRKSWTRKEVREFLPDITFRRKNTKLDFTCKGKTTTVSVTSSKLKFANSWYYLIAISPTTKSVHLKGKSQRDRLNEKI